MNSVRNLKLIIVALLVLLAFSLYYSSFKSTSLATVPSTKAICNDYSSDNVSTLKATLVKDLIDRYRNNQLRYINDHMDESDAHSIWFDLDTIKKFIYHIEKNVQQNSTATNNKLGLRIYYAAYPEQSQFGMPGYEDLADLNNSPLTKMYGLKHTLVFIPTIYNQTVDGDVDFNPLDTSTYNGYISMEKKLKVDNDRELKAEYLSAGYEPMALSTDRVVARNHGSLIPPATTIVEGF